MQIALASRINQASGGAVIAPWQVDDLPETWLDAFRFSVDELPSASMAMQKIRSAQNAWLASHPTYRKS